MSLTIKSTFVVTLFFALFCLSTSKADASVTSRYSPTAVDESVATITIHYDDLPVPDHDYWIGANDGENRFKFHSTGTSADVVVCGSLGKTDTFTNNCGAGSYFDAGVNGASQRNYGAKLYKGKDDANSDYLDTLLVLVKRYYPRIDFSQGESTKAIIVQITGSRQPLGSANRNNYRIQVDGINGTPSPTSRNDYCVTSLNNAPAPADLGPFANGKYVARIDEETHEGSPGDCKSADGFHYRRIEFEVSDTGVTKISETGGDSGTGKNDTPCGADKNCNPCASGTCQTALGDISTSIKSLTASIMNIAFGLAGGLALILMVIGSIRVLASSGDQQRLNGGREMIVAAVAGLLFLIFAVLILRFIGFQIFGGVPGIS